MTETLVETSSLIEAPPPGVYEGIPDEEYHRWDCCSHSRLVKMAVSPLHCYAASQRSVTTRAMRLGTATHIAVLQPDEFDRRFVVAGPCAAVTGKGEACSNQGVVLDAAAGWLCGVHRKKMLAQARTDIEILTADELERCRGCRDGVYSHSRAGALFGGPGRQELSIVWIDRETGLKCKARLDKLAETGRGKIICDLKTCRSAKPSVFKRDVFARGYHLQACMYLEGAKENGLDAQHFVFVPVESEPPHAVSALRITDAVIAATHDQYRELLDAYDQCLDSGVWPAYGSQIEDLDLPDWDWKRLTGEIE